MNSIEAKEYVSYLNSCIQASKQIELYSEHHAERINYIAKNLSSQLKQVKSIIIPAKKVMTSSNKGLEISLMHLDLREGSAHHKNKFAAQPKKLPPPVIHTMAMRGKVIQQQHRPSLYSQIKTSSNIALRLK